MGKRTLVIEIDDPHTEGNLSDGQLTALRNAAAAVVARHLFDGDVAISAHAFNGPSVEARLARMTTFRERLINEAIRQDITDPQAIEAEVSAVEERGIDTGELDDSRQALEALIHEARERLGQDDSDPIASALRDHGVDPNDSPSP